MWSKPPATNAQVFDGSKECFAPAPLGWAASAMNSSATAPSPAVSMAQLLSQQWPTLATLAPLTKHECRHAQKMVQ